MGNEAWWQSDANQIVDGGHRAIKYSRLHGIRSDIYPEGTHLVVCRLSTLSCLPATSPLHPKAIPHFPRPTHTNDQLPWLESPIIYDVRAKPRNIASLTGTKDLQMVSSLTLP